MTWTEQVRVEWRSGGWVMVNLPTSEFREFLCWNFGAQGLAGTFQCGEVQAMWIRRDGLTICANICWKAYRRGSVLVQPTTSHHLLSPVVPGINWYLFHHRGPSIAITLFCHHQFQLGITTMALGGNTDTSVSCGHLLLINLCSYRNWEIRCFCSILIK